VAPRLRLTTIAAAPAGFRRAIVAGVSSLLVPGTGQLALGARRRGRVMVGVTSLVLLVAAWQRARGVGSLLELLVQPGTSAAFLVGIAVLALFHLAATLDAFRLGLGGGRPPSTAPGRTLGVAGLLLTLSVAAAVPYALAAHHLLVLDETLGSVFADGGAASVDADATSGSDQGASRGEVDPGPWLEQDRFSVAVLGSDAHPTRTGARLDALLVVSIDPADGAATVFSVERHLRDFPLPEGLAEPWEAHCRDVARGWELLNALYRCGDEVLVEQVARQYPEAPDPAAAAVAAALGELLGLPIDHYVLVDMRGLVTLVDALGGVTLDLDAPAREGGCDWRRFDVQPRGPELDGAAVLELVRTRDGTSSADRMGRQRCLLATLAQEVDVASLLWRFGSVAGVIREHVETSIPMHELPNLVALLGHLDRDRIETVGFERPGYVSPAARPYVEQIRATVQRTLDGTRVDAARRAPAR
jgi:polyisoprenyl-teichoic acid--peptidoglycan teichoic acid transferase